jgi:hypothetical protein
MQVSSINSIFKNAVLPSWVGYGAVVLLGVVLWGHGYTKGQANVYEKQATATAKVILLQGKTTTKVITKYIKQQEKQKPIEEQIKNEGQAYAIKFPDNYTFNNEYVRLYNQSVTGELSSLPSGNPEDSSGVTPATSLEVGINNNQVARDWKDRALTCELWAKEQEEALQ